MNVSVQIYVQPNFSLITELAPPMYKVLGVLERKVFELWS